MSEWKGFPNVYQQFVKEVEAEGWPHEEYERRYGDARPAVRVDDFEELQRLIRGTTVSLDWDTLGTGWIVYPAKREA